MTKKEKFAALNREKQDIMELYIRQILINQCDIMSALGELTDKDITKSNLNNSVDFTIDMMKKLRDLETNLTELRKEAGI